MRAFSISRPRIAPGIPKLGLRFALMFAVGLCAACDSDSDYFTLERRMNIALSPLYARLPVGDTVRIRAVSNGQPCDCLWMTLDAARATVDETGLVRALTPGAVHVVATVRRDQNTKASLLVDVIAP